MKRNPFRISTRQGLFIGPLVATQVRVGVGAAWRSAAVKARTAAVMKPLQAKQQAAAPWSALLFTNIAHMRATAIGNDAELETLFQPRIASTAEAMNPSLASLIGPWRPATDSIGTASRERVATCRLQRA